MALTSLDFSPHHVLTQHFDLYLSVSASGPHFSAIYLRDIRVGGLACVVRWQHAGTTDYLYRIQLPAGLGPGAHDLTVVDGEGDTTTCATQVNITGGNRLFLKFPPEGTFSYVPNAEGDDGYPTTEQALGTMSGGTSQYAFNSQFFYRMQLNPSTTPPAGGNTLLTCWPDTGVVARLPVASFITPRMTRVRHLRSGFWGFVGGHRVNVYEGETSGRFDKIALYVWRPATQSKVATIFDNTADDHHPAGSSSAWHPDPGQDNWTVTGAFYFNGCGAWIEEGDRLVLEVWGLVTSTAPTPILQFVHNGATVPTTNNGVLTTTDVAAYLDLPHDLFGPTVKLTIPPDQRGYKMAPGTAVLVASPEGGRQYARRDLFEPTSALSVSWSVERAGYEYLRSFFATYGAKGEAFLVDLIVSVGSVAEYEARFVPGSFKLASVNGLTFRVEALLEVWARQRSDAELEAVPVPPT